MAAAEVDKRDNCARYLATAAVALGAALVGVVVAGLAVVVALLDDELLVLMNKDEKSGRVAGHLFPYWFVTGTGVATFLLSLLLLLAGSAMPAWAARILFAAVIVAVVGAIIVIFAAGALGGRRQTRFGWH